MRSDGDLRHGPNGGLTVDLFTPEKLQVIGNLLYGYRWRAVLAKKLRRSERTVDRWMDRKAALPAELPLQLRELIAEQMAALSDCAERRLGQDALMGN